MNIIQLILIFKRHVLLLLLVPVLLAGVVAYLTKNPTLQYESKTIIYTGIASGYNLEQNQKFDMFGSRNAFDNLINVVKSRETLSETAVRLFVKCLSLDAYKKTIISKNSFIELRRDTPPYIKNMVVVPVFVNDSSARNEAYEQSVEIFLDYLNSSDTNFIYNLLNNKHRFFSIRAISGISVRRVQSSDLIDIKYKSDDRSICLRVPLSEVWIMLSNSVTFSISSKTGWANDIFSCSGLLKARWYIRASFSYLFFISSS